VKWSLGLVVLAALALCGCHRRAFDQPGNAGHGRYVGVGHYAPGPAWARVVHPDQSNDPARARLADDDQIIVVMDSDSGEIRQCGNLSGVCVSLSPWSRPVAASQVAPVELTKHADQAGQAAQDANTAAATPAR
jgi:hypothetical protein